MGDRFIPNRSLKDMELAHSLMAPMDNKMTSTPTSSVSSPSRDEYRRRLKENMMLDSNGKPFRMLVFGEKPRACRRNRINEEDLLLDRLRPTSRNHRLPKLAGQVLNAKNLLDDYYANILDWGKNNLLAIALGSSVYIRNQATGKARLLLTVNEDLPTSVSWSGDGKILAVGFTSSRIMLWDVAASRRVGTLMMHEDKGFKAMNSGDTTTLGQATSFSSARASRRLLTNSSNTLREPAV